MAASTFDGSLVYWHQGLPQAAVAKNGSDGSYVYWHDGMGLLRNLGAGPEPIILQTFASEFIPARQTVQVVPYGQQ